MPGLNPAAGQPAAASQGRDRSTNKPPAGFRKIQIRGQYFSLGLPGTVPRGLKKRNKGASRKKAAYRKDRVSPARTEPRGEVRGEEEDKSSDEKPILDDEVDPDTGMAVKKCSELPYNDFTLPGERVAFGRACEALEVGRILMARLYDTVDLLEADAAFLIREIKGHDSGPMLGTDFIGSSKPASEIHIEIRDGAGESIKVGDGAGMSMIHLCREYPECGHLSDVPNTLHLSKWKVGSTRQMDDEWLAASTLRKCEEPKEKEGQEPLAPPPPPAPASKRPIEDKKDEPPKKTVASEGTSSDTSGSELPARSPSDDKKKEKGENSRSPTLPPVSSAAEESSALEKLKAEGLEVTDVGPAGPADKDEEHPKEAVTSGGATSDTSDSELPAQSPRDDKKKEESDDSRSSTQPPESSTAEESTALERPKAGELKGTDAGPAGPSGRSPQATIKYPKAELDEDGKKGEEKEKKESEKKRTTEKGKKKNESKEQYGLSGRQNAAPLLTTPRAKIGKRGRSSSGDDDYSEEYSSRERGRSKRQKKKKKEEDEGSQSPDERERSSSGSSNTSESSGASSFSRAGGGKNGLASKLQKAARRHPGRLLQKTLRAMYATLKPGSAPLPDHKKPAIFFNYLQQTLSQRPRKDGRAEREMTTLAMSCDRILEGKLEEALDMMSQRFKRVEGQYSGKIKERVASRMELIPDPRVTPLPRKEREEEVDRERKVQRVRHRDGAELKPRGLTPVSLARLRPPAAEEAPALTRTQRKRQNWRARLKEKKKKANPRPPAAAKPNDQPMPWKIQRRKGKGTNGVKGQKGKAKGKGKW